MNHFFNPENGGVSSLHGFFGQVVDEAYWADNHANSRFDHKLHSSSDIAGYGYRYKVRIFGRDTNIKNFSDDQLEMAEVCLPVTAGSGHGGSVQTPNIKQGCYVWGFYKDGIDATEPIIYGILPNNAQTSLFGGDTSTNFEPRSGYFGARQKFPVATKNIQFDFKTGTLPTIEAINANVVSIRDVDKNIDGTRSFYIPKTINCEGPSGELDGLQKTIKQLLIDVKRARSFTQSFVGAASDLGSNVNNLISQATLFASALTKSLITKIRGFVVNYLNKQIALAFDLLPPNLRPNLAQGAEIGTNTVQCIFNKIISKLMSILNQLLRDIVDRYINAPLCAVESFIGSFFSTILGELVSGITEAMSSILGPIGDIAGVILQAFDIFIGILNFLSCEEDLDCQILDQWSFFNGSSLNIESILGSKTSNSIKSFIDQGNSSAPLCNTSQIPCGPPTISFFGSGTETATGNAIVSGTGYIIGVDLISGGRYTAPPDVRVIDDCGTGSGAVLVPIMEDVGGGESTVIDVVVVDPGFGYLTTPNGSTGGDGVTFSNPSDTIIGVNVYPPNTVIQVSSGQTAFFPANSVVEIIGNIGSSTTGTSNISANIGTNIDVTQPTIGIAVTINGEGQTTPVIIPIDGTLTTPDNETETFDQNSPTYPILVCINDLAILNEGVNYSSGDTIEIIPDNGTVVEPIIDNFGRITDINIISKGCGFTDIPEIRLNTQTGINAVLVPVFKFQKIDDLDNISQLTPNDIVVNVVDCVGKFPGKL
jgi:hypothetical protein